MHSWQLLRYAAEKLTRRRKGLAEDYLLHAGLIVKGGSVAFRGGKGAEALSLTLADRYL